MRVAIATDGENVAAHFGHCERYTLFSIDGQDQIAEQGEIRTPGHQPGVLPPLLSDNRVEFVVAGGMGPRAQQMFAEFGIRTVVGVTGKVADAVKALAAGTLAGTGEPCPGGMHECEDESH
jgi:predicted Fe-Mo cluster-binding NifX family protein